MIEAITLDLIDVEDGVGPHDEQAVLGLVTVLGPGLDADSRQRHSSP
jgi:hypothetical protein